jgi:lambda repressor-like predicted transcriptional regulator
VAVGADFMSAELIAEILSETPIEIWENRLKKIKNTQNPGPMYW